MGRRWDDKKRFFFASYKLQFYLQRKTILKVDRWEFSLYLHSQLHSREQSSHMCKKIPLVDTTTCDFFSAQESNMKSLPYKSCTPLKTFKLKIKSMHLYWNSKQKLRFSSWKRVFWEKKIFKKFRCFVKLMSDALG